MESCQAHRRSAPSVAESRKAQRKNHREALRNPEAAETRVVIFLKLLLSSILAAAGREEVIRVELRHGATTMTVTWPVSAAADCAAWMRELLRCPG